MKKLTKLLFITMLVIFASCESESENDSQSVQEREILDEADILVSDGEEDNELIFTSDSEILKGYNPGMVMKSGSSNAAVDKVYNVIDADRAPYGSQQPNANFWWSETPDTSDYFDASTYFSSDENNSLVFTEYVNGTASLVGSTVSGSCTIEVNVWFKDKKTWAEWSADGGGHKKEGTAGNASNSADLNFYIIDHTKSTMIATGGDCAQEGTFGVTQRPDPNDPNTPNFGSHVGPGGANYDSNVGANGISSWGWLIDPVSCAPLWLMDFNFRIEEVVEECDDCIGGVTDLTLNYDWYNNKRVRVYQRVENTCYVTKIFDENLSSGEDFTFSGSNADGTIGKYAYIYIDHCYYTKIKTNCALNIGPGYTKGIFDVVSGHSSGGGELCEYVQPDNRCYRHWYCYYNLNYCYYGW